MLNEKKVEIVMFNDIYNIIKRRMQNYIEIVATIVCKRHVPDLKTELSSGRMVIRRIDGTYKIVFLHSDNVSEEIANITINTHSIDYHFEEQIISLESILDLLKRGKIEIGILNDDQIFYHHRARNILQILAINSMCIENLSHKLISNDLTIISLNGKQNIVERYESEEKFKIVSHLHVNSNQCAQVACAFVNEIQKIFTQQSTNVKILKSNGQQLVSKYYKEGNIMKIIAVVDPNLQNVMERAREGSIDVVDINGSLKMVETNAETETVQVVANIYKKELECEIGQYIFLNFDNEHCIARSRDKNSFEIIAKASFIEVSNMKDIPTVFIPIEKA